MSSKSVETVTEKTAMNAVIEGQPAIGKKSLKDIVNDGLEEKGKGKDMWLW